jgi:hypothetical protein
MGFGRRAIQVTRMGVNVATLGETGDLEADQIPVPDIEAVVAGVGAATADKLKFPRSISLAGDVVGSAIFDGSANVSISAAITADSHNHTVANVDGLQNALDGKLAVGATAADSSKLGGLNSTQFMRSDATDIKTSGYTRYNDSVSTYWGDGADLSVVHSNNNSYIQSGSGNLYIKQRHHGSTILLQAEDSAGVNRGAIYARADYQSLFGGGTEKLRVDNEGIKVYGSVSELSSRELKNVLGTPENPLDKIADLIPVIYSLKDDENQSRHLGLIAEDVPDDLLIAEKEGEPHERGIDYARLSVWAIAAIQELKQRLEALEA